MTPAEAAVMNAAREWRAAGMALDAISICSTLGHSDEWSAALDAATAADNALAAAVDELDKEK